MTEKTMENYYVLSERFIALANEMTVEGKDPQMVNAALMSLQVFMQPIQQLEMMEG